jgi:polyisoprenoid-binding protein YceI
MKTQLLVLLLAFALAPFTTGQAQVYSTDSGYAEFAARAPLNSYTGRSNQLKGTFDLAAGTLEFRLPMQSLDTGNDTRDRHMYDLMQVEDYPYARFEGRFVAADLDLESGTEQQVAVTGEFTLRGTTRTLEITGNLRQSGDQLTVEADWPVLLSDYNIERPTLLLIYTVKDKHELHIEATLAPTASTPE